MNNIQDKKYFDDISEAIKVYEELRKYKNGDFIETIDPDFFFNLTDCIIANYNILKRENEELKEQLEYDKTHIFTPMTINLNYISKQKIKDNIEEINKRIDYIKTELTKLYIENETSTETEIDSNEYYIYNLEKEEELRYSQKTILQQLLKESEGK